MEDTGLYVYGILNINPEDKPMDIPGIDGIYNIDAIEKSGFYIIASPVNLKVYGEGEIDKYLEDMVWIEERARRHFNTQQKLSEIGVFIPMKFCTIFKCEQSLHEFFNGYVNELIEAFKYLKDKEEWTVKLYCDRKKFIEFNMNEERREIQQKAKSTSKGASYFLLKKMEVTLDEKSRDKIAKLKDQLWAAIRDKAEKAALNKNLSKQVTEMNEDMVLNTALLVNKDNIKILANEIEKQKELLNHYNMRIDMAGPWPFYNFSGSIIS